MANFLNFINSTYDKTWPLSWWVKWFAITPRKRQAILLTWLNDYFKNFQRFLQIRASPDTTKDTVNFALLGWCCFSPRNYSWIVWPHHRAAGPRSEIRDFGTNIYLREWLACLSNRRAVELCLRFRLIENWTGWFKLSLKTSSGLLVCGKIIPDCSNSDELQRQN